MYDRQAGRVEEAAQKFAEALIESYKAVSERSVSVAQLNAELTQSFFNGVISNLRAQTERNREAAQKLADLQQRQQEAMQALTQESVGAYVGFINSVFSYYGGGAKAAAPTETAPEGPAGGGELPLEDYDSLNVREVSEKLDDLSVEEIRQLRDYEVRNKDRRTLMKRFNARIEAYCSS